MAPLNDSTRVVLPLGWVAASCLTVTLFVCGFFYLSIDKLKEDVHQLQVDIAVIKDHIAPTDKHNTASNP